MKVKQYVMIIPMLFSFFLLNACSNGEFSFEHSINIISREDGSGTRGAFNEITGIIAKNQDGENYDYTDVEAAITNSTSVVMTAVSSDPHGIGYLSLGSLNDTVKVISIDNVKPNIQEIRDANYPIARPFLIVTKEERSPIAQDFIDFVLSVEGQEVVKNSGYVPIKENKGGYKSSNYSGKIVVGGSSSVTPVMEKIKEAYLLLNDHVTVEIQQSDSTTGVASVDTGIYDIGMASRELKESEASKDLQARVIGMDGIVVIVNKKNSIENLSLDQVKKIFVGEISHWQEAEDAKK